MGRGLLGAPVVPVLCPVLCLVVGLVLGPALLPWSAAADEAPDPGHPWFGPALDIHTDTPSAYAERLGATPSLYTFPVDYPLTEEGVDQLHRFAAEVAEQGAVLVLQVEPTVPLSELGAGDADELGALVAGLADDPGLTTLVRFAPEMNGSWRPWGQQPTRYVTEFRTVADAVHASAPTAAMVWSPVYGSGYPFSLETGADSEIDLSESRELAPLDTDGDGRLDSGDDPYGPYYPGDAYVDWVGLFLYRFGQSQGITRNVLPPAGELESRLADRWGYPAPAGPSFYERFSAGRDKRLLLETAALHNPSVGGASNLALKQRWWREVLASLPGHPLIGGISWLELEREEPEVADEPVDWRATSPAPVAAALRADLTDSPVQLGPVTTPRQIRDEQAADDQPSRAALQPLATGPAAGDLAARVAAGLLVLTLLLTWLGTRRPGWAYPATTERDERIDLLRGLLLAGTVALQLPVGGVLHDAASGALALGGLETFVLLSGLCVGLVYPPVARRLGQVAAAGRRWRRGLLTWVATLATVVVVYVLGQLPRVALGDVATLRVDGADLDLYAGAEHLFDYPPPGWIAQHLLWLQLGTWLLLPLALLIALQLLSPVAAGPLSRGWWWAVLPASWAAYAVGRWSDAELLPSYSEVVAPLLVWQVLFVHGIAAASQRTALAAHRRAVGACLVVAVLVAAGLLATGLAPTGSSAELPLPRIVVVVAAAAAALAALTTCWRPAVRFTGTALVPLGRMPLLVVLSTAVLAVLVTALPETDGWVGTAVTVAAVALLVGLARWRSPARQPVPATVAG